MKKVVLKIIGVFGLFALTFGAAPVWADDDSPVSGSADVAFSSQYVWRGMGLSESSIVIQPSATISYEGFSINLWGNLDTDLDGYGEKSFNETDLTLSYDWSLDMISIGVGYIYYGLAGAYPVIEYDEETEAITSADARELEDTQELYLSVGFDTILAPSITIYRDIDAAEGWYINLGIGHSIAFSDEMALDLGASVGYSDYDGISNLTDGSISASITFAANEYISITPSIAYTFALTDDGEDYLKGLSLDSDSQHFFGGITCSISF